MPAVAFKSIGDICRHHTVVRNEERRPLMFFPVAMHTPAGRHNRTIACELRKLEMETPGIMAVR